MAEATLGTVTAKVTTDNSQFDSAMQKSSEIMGATARENAKAAKMQADAIAFAAKFSGDAVSEQSLRIVTSLKLQSSAEADLRRAKQLSKALDEDGSTKLLAASYQRLAAARMESAAAARIETEASEATVLTQRQAVSAVVRASEGQQGIRAVEGFLTMIPGVGAALQNIFPLIGGAMFISMLARMGTELYDLEQKGKHSAEELSRAFGQFNDKLETANDELALTDSKLKDQIGRLSGHPSNGLETALLEAKVAADKLEESLAADVKQMQELLKQHSVAPFEGMLAGVKPTGPAEAAINTRSNTMNDAVQQARYALDAELANAKSAHQKAAEEAGNNHDRLKTADDAYNAARLSAQQKYNAAAKQAALDFAKWSEEQASMVPAPSRAKGAALSAVASAVGGPAAGAAVTAYERGQQGDPTQTRKQYEQAARTARDLANRVDLEGDVFSDTATVGAMEQNKALTGGVDKAAEERLRAMELELDNEKRQFGMTLKTELEYWDARIGQFDKKSAEYKTISDKETAIAVAGANASAAVIKRFKEQQLHEQISGDRERDAALAEGGKAMRGMSKERDDAQRAAFGASNDIWAAQQQAEIRRAEFSTQSFSTNAGKQARQMAELHELSYMAASQNLASKANEVNSSGLTDAEKGERLRRLADEQARLDTERALQQAEDAKRIESTTLLGGANDALREFMLEATDAGAAMKQWLSGSLNTTNDAIVRAMTGGKADFGAAGHEIFTNATSSLLKSAEGNLMKALGIGGKKDGSSEAAALWVRIVQASGGSPSGIPGLAVDPLISGLGKLAGGMHLPGMPENNSGAASSAGFLSKLGGFAMHVIPGFATGTDFAPGGMALLGEDGPEIVNLPRGASVTPNNRIGTGDSSQTIHFHPGAIDARGATDPAAVEAAGYRGAMRALRQQPHPMVVVKDYQNRHPSMTR